MDQVSLFEPTDIESLETLITGILNKQIEENGLSGLQVSFSALKSVGSAKTLLSAFTAARKRYTWNCLTMGNPELIAIRIS